MDIIVCVKQIIDPEIPSHDFKIDPRAKRAVPLQGENPFTVNDYDAVAVEAAIQIKESMGGKITLLNFENQPADKTIKYCLATGADEAILLADPLFEEEDRSLTAYVLSMAIKKIQNFDLIFCGRQEGDWDAGQVGVGIAEMLGIPSVSPVRKVEISGRNILVERIVEDGYEVIELPLPALVSVSSELCTPRLPSLKGIAAASKKKLTTWTAQDIGADPSKLGPLASKVKMLKLFKPIHEARCVIVEGETPAEAGANLAVRLRREKVI